jgi:membrane-bound lytic murein transglycosylase D
VALATTAAPADPADAPPPTGSAASGADAFPEYESIRGNIDFWTRVFAQWSQGQVAVHHYDYPAIVYEVVDLPGQIEARYTEDQLDFVDALSEAWEDRLKTLAKKVASGKPLDEDEKEWALLISTNAGSAAIEDAHKRVRTQRGLRERFRRGIEIANRYEAELTLIFREAGLPEDLAYLPHVESSFQAAARSSAGAVGVWQFTRGTGRRFMYITAAIDERLDPIAAAYGAARYLGDAYDELGSWPIALTSYNHGVVGMKRAVAKHGNDYERIYLEYDGRSFGFASKNFYAEFLAARRIATNVESYFPEGVTPEPQLALDRILLEERTTPAALARAYELPLAELAALNPAWSRRAVKNGMLLPKETLVWLPEGHLERMADQGKTADYSPNGWIEGDGEYVVQPGDTLSTIARSYGLKLSRLRALNDIPSNDSRIYVGQRLRISDHAGTGIHVVRPGEALSTIARTYHMSLDALRELNGIQADDHLIRIGQRLRVNGAGTADIHVVRRGDTLLRIATVYGVRFTELLSVNRLSEASIIYPGQKLRIPGR